MAKAQSVTNSCPMLYSPDRFNSGRFQGTVHPPLFMTISLRDLRFARQIEECIPERDLTAFVFENAADQQASLLISYMPLK